METASLRDTLNGIWYSVKTCFKISKRFVLWRIARRLLAAVVAPLSTYFMMELVRALTNMDGGGDIGLLNQAITALLIYVLMGFIMGKIQLLSDGIDARDNSIVWRSVETTFNEKMTRVQMQSFQMPEFHNLMNLAWGQPGTYGDMFNAATRVIENIISLAGLIIILVGIEWWLPILIFAFAFPSVLLDKKYQKMRREHQLTMQKINRVGRFFSYVVMSEEFSEEVKIFNTRSYFRENSARMQQESFDMDFVIFFKELKYSVIQFVFSVMGGMVCLFGALYKVYGKIGSTADVSGALVIMGQIEGAISSIIWNYSELSTKANDLKKFRTFLNDTTYDEISGNSQHILAEAGGLPPIETIEFKNVTFSYKRDGKNALDNLSFKINRGEYIALAGRNGSGKTTLTKLIAGQYLPTSGTIYYNGIPHYELNQNDIQKQCSILYQTFAYYPLTIRENITLSNEFDEARLKYAIEQSGMNEVIAEHKNGLETKLLPEFFDDAVNLSVGQWQRLALARAFYKRAGIVIMDEPSASIDPIAEAEIFAAINLYTEPRIKFTISHRLSYMSEVSRIILLEDGLIVEDGNFDELIKNDSTFKHLYEIQASRYTEETDSKEAAV